jgi:N-acyl-D-amino-acid deacylase
VLDTILRHGTLIDGTRKPRFPGDIGLQGDRIAVIGNLADTPAREQIDVQGKVVAPAFVDVHTHSDGRLLQSPRMECKLSQGFATEVLMLDGISYAPVDEHNIAQWLFYLRALNGLRLDDYRGWRSLADYMRLLDQTTAHNSVALVPYANVRALACGFGRARPDDFQMRTIRRHIQEGMESGAAGLSTGMDYIVQCHADTDELIEACQAMAPYDGIYVTHVRYKKGLIPALEEALEIGRRAGVRVHISHLKPAHPGQHEEVFELLERESRNVDVTFDVYPYLSGSTMLNFLLPYEVWDQGPLAVLDQLRSPEVRRRFGEGLEDYRAQFPHARIAWLLSAENKRHQGETLEQFLAAHEGSAADVLCDLLIEERLAVLLVLGETEDRLIEPMLQHELYMMGSDGIYHEDGPVHARVFGSAPRLLGQLVRDRGLMSLEEAIYKLSAFPATRYGLTDRGTLKAGQFADVVVFDPERIGDRTSAEAPRAQAVGIEQLYVNGRRVWSDSEEQLPISRETPGRWLRYRENCVLS